MMDTPIFDSGASTQSSHWVSSPTTVCWWDHHPGRNGCLVTDSNFLRNSVWW
ncbi:uncharacterized protein BDW47DRAFT_110841 [Aspergillus candidus]|uniref:Uncharacterized protein n=1 Tax=Aspergillus candidus TaxID=41067 RepID=A0A2I2F3H9_ASPCN|nr:hypothetical protein BDW47DRAFT_110841 [Aspergillus candidus]PLB35169.1 hypothetical protein BDW47DRAFT_110841 [Aspergillus candidus]